MHPATEHLLQQFQYEHLPPALREIAQPMQMMAVTMATVLGSGPELSTGLRKLIEAKDCLVRQRVMDLCEANKPAPVNTPEEFITKDHGNA